MGEQLLQCAELAAEGSVRERGRPLLVTCVGGGAQLE
jgi:hypothetical protein